MCGELIKAFLNWKQVQYPKTHVLTALLDMAVPHQPELEDFRGRLLGMVTYAVEMRYDDEIYPTVEEIQTAIETTRDLRQKILSLLPAQKS